MQGPTQDLAGFTEECGFLEEEKESYLVIKKKQKCTNSASKIS